MAQLDFPYHFDGRDRTAAATEAKHIRDLIEQILFTSPGERVNRPEFGAGVLQMVFAPASPEAAATAEFMIKGALQQYLGQRIEIGEVQAQAQESTMRIRISYRLLRDDTEAVAEFEMGGGP